MRKEDWFALISIVVAVMAMAFPFAYPDLPLGIWRILFWGGFAITTFSCFFLVYGLLFRPRYDGDKSSETQSSDQHNEKHIIQNLHNELYNIGEDYRLNYQNVQNAIDELRRWHDKATTIISKLFGPDEVKKLIEKKDFIEKKDEYRNPSVGGIKAFNNEKELYLTYLTGLMKDIENHPALFNND